ncbi:unnamed protein product [Acanthosepion pharaonis]|uniref:Transmembrane protein n=1 Tax=Acanthosepion pharaonis TaxID=158019 RepID=A0A812CD13_ACAPH|nr:unnamed protein product [Sepia pharaonis]
MKTNAYSLVLILQLSLSLSLFLFFPEIFFSFFKYRFLICRRENNFLSFINSSSLPPSSSLSLFIPLSSSLHKFFFFLSSSLSSLFINLIFFVQKILSQFWKCFICQKNFSSFFISFFSSKSLSSSFSSSFSVLSLFISLHLSIFSSFFSFIKIISLSIFFFFFLRLHFIFNILNKADVIYFQCFIMLSFLSLVFSHRYVF